VQQQMTALGGHVVGPEARAGRGAARVGCCCCVLRRLGAEAGRAEQVAAREEDGGGGWRRLVPGFSGLDFLDRVVPVNVSGPESGPFGGRSRGRERTTRFRPSRAVAGGWPAVGLRSRPAEGELGPCVLESVTWSCSARKPAAVATPVSASRQPPAIS
jgi:hypothetical protein